MEIPFEIFQKVDATNLIAMGIMLFFMYCRIESKAEKRVLDLDKKFDKIDKRFDKVDERFDKLEEKVTDIDRRLCRLEGAFASKDCCMIKDERQIKKAV